MGVIWTEETIREEMRRLDAVTGLKGSEVPIVFGYARQTLGLFQYTREGKPALFRFSRHFLDDPNFSHAQALDLIRHEYAHYMNLMRNGREHGSGHGENWKQCCREIGAAPERCYQPAQNEVSLRRERGLEKLEKHIAMLRVQMRLRHPVFGEGVLTEILKTESGARLTIRFAAESRTLDARWVLDNCRLVRDDAAGDS